jgi:hypothetical protein
MRRRLICVYKLFSEGIGERYPLHGGELRSGGLLERGGVYGVLSGRKELAVLLQ